MLRDMLRTTLSQVELRHLGGEHLILIYDAYLGRNMLPENVPEGLTLVFHLFPIDMRGSPDDDRPNLFAFDDLRHTDRQRHIVMKRRQTERYPGLWIGKSDTDISRAISS